MAAVLTLLKKDFLRVSRNRLALILLLIAPLALIVLFGQIYGVNRKDSGPIGVPLAVVDESRSAAAAGLIAALEAEPAFRVIKDRSEAELRTAMRKNEFRFALILPPDLVRAGRAGLHLILLSNPRNSVETSTITGILQKVIYTTAPGLLLNSAVPSAAVDDGAPLMERLVKLDREQVVGNDVKSPQATQVVGGWAMQFLLFALSNAAAAIYMEKDLGLYQRLLSGPVTRAQIVWSKFLYGVLLGLIQLMVLFLGGEFLYGIDVVHHLVPLALVCALAAATCTAFGLLIASIMPTAEAAAGTATLLILLMSATGGAWFPVSFLPAFIQRISIFSPVYWSIRGFEQVLWSHDSFLQLLPTLGILAVIAAGVMAFAAWRLSRSRVFQ